MYYNVYIYKQPVVKDYDEETHCPTGNLTPPFYTSAKRQMADHLAIHQFVTSICDWH